MRDAQGNLIHAEGSIIEEKDNIEAEAKAILYAATHCNQTGQERVIIQTDSLALQKFINQLWEVPWKIVDIIEKIKQLMAG